ncbi:phosphorylcholine transferase LicD [uncultured Dysosmobacter sp.]|uniref:LicD family protein n=1 Tax=uncultured Dysosmobacter sp. TaxID=2591384 RepID=UPI002616164D|nr:LicD family protein [uncultured Dysosmobacter sp.]
MSLTYEEMKDKLEKIHEITFELLCAIDDYCHENNITYYLSGGTCLGAARHQGFIPWDGDADIMLPRKDYEKLVQTFAGAYPGKYAVGELNGCEGWHRSFAKIWDLKTKVRYRNRQEVTMGIHVDVFPVDGLPDTKWKQKLLYRKVTVLSKVRGSLIRNQINENERHKVLKRIIDPVLKRLCRNPLGSACRIGRMIEKGSKKYDFDTSKYVAVSVVDHYGERETLRREDMEHPVYLKFEGRDMPVFNGYKNYLQNLYGLDYMKIPTDDTIKYDTVDWHYLESVDIELHNTKADEK